MKGLVLVVGLVLVGCGDPPWVEQGEEPGAADGGLDCSELSIRTEEPDAVEIGSADYFVHHLQAEAVTSYDSQCAWDPVARLLTCGNLTVELPEEGCGRVTAGRFLTDGGPSTMTQDGEGVARLTRVRHIETGGEILRGQFLLPAHNTDDYRVRIGGAFRVVDP